MHQALLDVRRNLLRATDAWDLAVAQAITRIHSVVGDGTGSAQDKADAEAIAKAYDFEVTYAPVLKAEKPAKHEKADKPEEDAPHLSAAAQKRKDAKDARDEKG